MGESKFQETATERIKFILFTHLEWHKIYKENLQKKKKNGIKQKRKKNE